MSRFPNVPPAPTAALALSAGLLAALAGPSVAGGLDAPVIEPEIIVADTHDNSDAVVVPLAALVLLGLAAGQAAH